MTKGKMVLAGLGAAAFLVWMMNERTRARAEAAAAAISSVQAGRM